MRNRFIPLLLALFFGCAVWAQNGPSPQGGFPQSSGGGGGAVNLAGGSGSVTGILPPGNGGTGVNGTGSATLFYNQAGGFTTPAGSGTITPSTAGQVPVFTAASTIAGNPNLTYSGGGLTLGSSGGLVGTLVLFNSATNITSIVAPSTAAPITYTLPSVALTEVTAQPSSNGAMVLQSTAGARTAVNMSGDATLASTGAITLASKGTAGTYATPSSVTTDAQGRITSITAGSGGGGTPGGSNTQVQFNNSGVFAGDAGLTYGASELSVGDGSVNYGTVFVNAAAGNPGLLYLENGATTGGVIVYPAPGATTSVHWTAPQVTLTEVTAQPGANGAFVTQSTAGARGTQSPNGSPLDVNAPTAKSAGFSAVAGTTYSVTGTITMTVPTAVGAQGQPITIFMPGTSTMTVNTTSSQKFGGSASGAKVFTSAAATPITLLLESDNVNWHYTQGL
jgi:hypothetical protein